MSIPAQFIKDVEVAVKERVSIKTCLCSGGNIMSRDAFVSAIKDMSRREDDNGIDLFENENYPER